MITCPYHLGHYTVGDYVAYRHYIPVTVLFFFLIDVPYLLE